MAFFADAAVAEVAASAGLDFVMPDMEHAANSAATCQDFARAAAAYGIESIVRVRDSSGDDVLRLLEGGSGGILFPSVHSGPQAKQMVARCKYPPVGARGTCRMTRAARYGAETPRWANHVEEQNSGVIVLGLVETAHGARELRSIVESMDVVMIGRADLAADLGIPGQLDHPKIQEVVSTYEKVAADCGKPTAVMCYSAKEARSWQERGYQFIVYAADTWVLREAYSSWLDASRLEADQAGISSKSTDKDDQHAD
jgi:4-hydroxy-2-oxoheptanedioate aldolase